jgi:hypothetical protein
MRPRAHPSRDRSSDRQARCLSAVPKARANASSMRLPHPEKYSPPRPFPSRSPAARLRSCKRLPASGGVKVVSNSPNSHHAARPDSAYSAYLYGITEGDRRDSNPRPSEPQSVWPCPDPSSCVAVCGLDKEKTRPPKHQFSLCVRSCPMLYCCRIAAIAATGGRHSPDVTASLCVANPYKCFGARGCNTHPAEV